MTKRLIVVLCVAFSLSIEARDWSLDECVQYAIDHNIEIKVGEQQLDEARLQVTASRNAFLPQVNGNVSQSFNFGRGLTSSNTYANRNTSNFQIGANFNIPLFSGLRNLRTLEQSKLSLKQQVLQLENERDNVALNVMAQYLQALYSKEVVSVAESQVSLSQIELERRKELANNGKIAEVEVLEAESQLAQDRLTLVNAINDRSLALLELSQTLQLFDEEEFDVKSMIAEEDISLPTVDAVYRDALIVNNGIQASSAAIETAEAGVGVAKTGYIPTISLNGGIGSSYYKLNGIYNMPFKEQMRENYSTYLGISLNVPIFDGFSTRTTVRRARVQAVTARLQYDQTLSSLYKAIQQAHLQASGARSKLETCKVTESCARESYDAMSQKYQMGRATAIEYEQASNNLFKARIESLQARYEYMLRCRILSYYQKGRL